MGIIIPKSLLTLVVLKELETAVKAPWEEDLEDCFRLLRSKYPVDHEHIDTTFNDVMM